MKLLKFLAVALLLFASTSEATITAKRASKVVNQPNPLAGTLYRLNYTPSTTNSVKDTIMIYAPGGAASSVYYPFQTGNGDTTIVVSVTMATTAYDSAGDISINLDLTTSESISSTNSTKFAHVTTSQSSSSPNFIQSSAKTDTASIYVQKDMRVKAAGVGPAPGFRICYLEIDNVSISPVVIDIWIPAANWPKNYSTR